MAVHIRFSGGAGVTRAGVGATVAADYLMGTWTRGAGNQNVTVELYSANPATSIFCDLANPGNPNNPQVQFGVFRPTDDPDAPPTPNIHTHFWPPAISLGGRLVTLTIALGQEANEENWNLHYLKIQGTDNNGAAGSFLVRYYLRGPSF